ncbi:MAG TPA: RidA family protein [Frankiaceae bacterium]|nr:RidA family protein [Frankiaceae bacterium]
MIERYGSGAPWEPVVGYSRVVKAGGFVFVTGCTSIVDGEVVHDGDAYAQTRQALANVTTALASAGATPAQVVRTRIFVTGIGRWEEYGRAHAEVFGAAPPATSMVEVSALIDPRMLVEVEAQAWVGQA